jgi:hypothetical protein
MPPIHFAVMAARCVPCYFIAEMNTQVPRDVLATPECCQDIEFFAGIDPGFDDLYRNAFEWAFARSPMEGKVVIVANLPRDGRRVRAVANISSSLATVIRIEFAEDGSESEQNLTFD